MKHTRDNPNDFTSAWDPVMTPLVDTLDPNFHNAREQRERDQRWCEFNQSAVDQMVRGEIPVKCPWEDPRFQGLVIKALAAGGRYKRDSEKLAVIREVFGSKV